MTNLNCWLCGDTANTIKRGSRYVVQCGQCGVSTEAYRLKRDALEHWATLADRAGHPGTADADGGDPRWVRDIEYETGIEGEFLLDCWTSCAPNCGDDPAFAVTSNGSGFYNVLVNGWEISGVTNPARAILDIIAAVEVVS